MTVIQFRDPRTWLLRGLVAALIVAGCLAVFVPFAPGFPTTDYDDGWAFGLNAAVEKGMTFGQDIVFTFGPYASIYTKQYHPATDSRMLWSSALLALAFATGLIVLARDRYKLSALLIVPFLGLLGGVGDPLFLCLPLVFLLIVCKIAMPATDPAALVLTTAVRCSLALLTIALSLLPLIKGTFGAGSVAVLALASTLLMVRGHKALAVGGTLIFVFCLALFWMIANQPMTQLPAFFAEQESIVSGYSDAMSIRGPLREPLLYLIACCLLLLLHFRLFRTARLAGATLAIGLCALLFTAFKAGFVRHDEQP